MDRLWRKNRNPNRATLGLCPGVDLNRNFGYKWAHEVRQQLEIQFLDVTAYLVLM